MYSLSSSLSLSILWTGILVLLTSNTVHAQSEIFCNKNYTNNTIALEMQIHGACPQANPIADKINAIQNNQNVKQQIVNGAGNLAGGLVSLFGQNSGGNAPPQPDSAELAAAQAARAQAQAAMRQQQLNADAADVLNQTNSLMASMNGPSGASPPDSTAALNALLGGNAAAGESTAAISLILDDDPQTSTGSASTTATIAGLLGSSPTPQPAPVNFVIQNPQFAAAFAQSQNPPPDPRQAANLGDDLLDDKPVDPTWSDLVQGMKDTTEKWTNAAGDLLHSHPIDSLAQSFDSLKQSLGLKQDPSADTFDAGVHDCGVGMLAVALPHPAGGDAAAAACYNANARASMSILQMATD
jgi:hypothetical protein